MYLEFVDKLILKVNNVFTRIRLPILSRHNKVINLLSETSSHN